MPEYRMYTVDYNCHRGCGAENIECVDDHEAIQQALRTITSYDVEVWQLNRLSRCCLDMKKPHRSRQSTDAPQLTTCTPRIRPRGGPNFEKRFELQEQSAVRA